MNSSLWTFSIDKPFPLGRFNYVFQECLITLNFWEMSEERIPITTISLKKKKKTLSHVSCLCNKHWTTRRLHQYYWPLLVSLRPRLKAHAWKSSWVLLLRFPMADSSTSFPFENAALLKLHSKHLKGSPVFLNTLDAEVCAAKAHQGCFPLWRKFSWLEFFQVLAYVLPKVLCR